MFSLSYNTNGLRNLDLNKAIEEVSKAGYEGVELSFHSNHLHPLDSSTQEIEKLKKIITQISAKPICIATGAADLLSSEPFEPSLISQEEEGRQRRIELMCKTIEIAKFLEVSVVNFASGIFKKGMNSEKAWGNLIKSVEKCLNNAGEIILAIEPEPGMMIETTAQAISLIKEIGSPNLQLNLDVGHVQCCEDNLLESIAEAIGYTRHIHIEDIKGKVHHHEIPGEGDIDFYAVFQILKKYDYNHYLSVELYHHTDIWKTALNESRKYLLKQMQKL